MKDLRHGGFLFGMMYSMSEFIPNAAECGTDYRFETLSVESISALLNESESAFLPSATNPTQTSNEMVESMKDDPNFQILGYEEHNQPISYIVALSHKELNTLSIGPMYIGANHRGLGLGIAQVKEFIEYARLQGYSCVFTKTWSRNTAARHIFDAIGFVATKIKLDDRVDGDSTISYRLDIT